MDWPHAIIHIDMDTFFVSVERQSDPSLEGKPVIVGGGRDGNLRRGVVAACSYETRAFGVHSAMPLVRAVRLCPQAIVVPVGASDYGAATAKVRAVLNEFTDRIEMTSPDEAYIDLEGTMALHGPPIEAAHKLRRLVVHRTELPVSVGLARSRTFAKIASKLSKPQGLFVVFPGQEPSIARPLSLRALPGLGPKTAERLRSRGVHTLGQLSGLTEAEVTALIGDHGADLLRRLRGEGSAAVRPTRERHQVSTETTFSEDIGELSRLDGKLARMTMKVGARLRKSGRRARTLTIKIRYPDFKTTTRQAVLSPATFDDRALLRTAKTLLRSTWDRRTPLRLLGVGASNLGDSLQEDLFSAGSQQKDERLLTAVDAVRKRQGRDRLVWASTLDPPGKTKKPRDRT